jgi:hypothetical protein
MEKYMQLFQSRITPWLENGEHVYFHIGEPVVFQNKDELEIVIIDSERMKHTETGKLGYECICSDGERYFCDGDRIISWGM